MTTKNYKPPMKPAIETRKDGTRIRVSREYILGISSAFSDADHIALNDAKLGESLCPAQYWFADTPETRRILRVEERKSA